MQDSVAFLEKSGSHFCLSPDKDVSATFRDTLQKASFGGAQRAHSAARAEISFRHRCHLSSGVRDTQDRRGNIPQPDIAQVRVATRRGTETQHWSEMKQLPELNR